MGKLVTLEVDSVSFQLREPADFSWLRSLGKVFVVFDEQDSGNICFGVQDGDARRFVKYAGAHTREFNGDPAAAIQALRAASETYLALRHPVLVPLLQGIELPDGYALVFEWRDGECLHPHWKFPAPAKYTDPASPFYRFRRLPLEARLRTFGAVLDFHRHVERCGYVPVDFYDGSILYDFGSQMTWVCDIDFYRRGPFTNEMGRLWGSTRFMSPEEHTLGAVIDSRTSVYGMGATAFCLMGDDKDRSVARWTASEALFEVASRAVRDNPRDRYASVDELSTQWEKSSRT